MNKDEKVQLLRDIQAGKRKINELLPMEEIDFIQVEGEDFVTNRRTGERYSKDEFEVLQQKAPANQFFLVGAWSQYFPPPPMPCSDEVYMQYISKLFPSREEDIDLTPWPPTRQY